MRSAPAIGFEYRPSRLVAASTALLILLAILAVAASGGAIMLRVALAIVGVGYGSLAFRRYLHPRVAAVNWRSDGSVSITLAGSGAEVQGTLHDARVLGPLIALRLRWSTGAASLWLLPDNLDVDVRRRLRMRLALDGPHPSVNADSV